MRNQKNFSINGKGYYIALILCATAIGISGYLYHRNAPETQATSLAQVETNDIPAGAETAQDVEVIATEAPKKEKQAAASTTPSSPAPFQPATKPSTAAAEPSLPQPSGQLALKTAAPVEGEELFPYSMDCLSYNETTRDWRTHNGVDIGAEAGTEVHAAADGTVYTVYEDDTLGYTVVIRHDGGYITRYSSLAEKPTVTAGDQVTLGQAIGCVGSSALVESTMGSHVHFSVSCDNIPMDPLQFLSME